MLPGLVGEDITMRCTCVALVLSLVIGAPAQEVSRPSTRTNSPQLSQSLSGDWTGGFLLNGNWVAVDINLKQEKENLSGSADVVFPSYADSVATRGARLSSLTLDASTIGFEIPVGGEKIVFLGRERGEGISGRFEYGTAKGDF